MTISSHSDRARVAARDTAATVLLGATPDEALGRLHALLDGTTELVCAADDRGRLTYANRAWLAALGYTLDDALGLRALDLVAPEDRPQYSAVAQRLHAGSPFEELEVVLLARDGRRVVCRGRGESDLVEDPDAPGGRRCVGTRAVFRDVTAQRVAEAALAASEARYRAVIEGSLDAFLALRSVRDASGTIVDFEVVEASARAAALVRMPREDLVGQLLCELFPIARAHGHFARYVEVVETRRTVEWEQEPADPRVDARAVRVQAVPLEDGIALSLRDVSERWRAERERRLLLDVTRAIAAAPDADAAIATALGTICGALGLEYGESWAAPGAASRSDALVLGSVWHPATDRRLAAFAEASAAHTFARGVGLPGTAWERGTPALLAEPHPAGAPLPRTAAMRAAGLVATAAVPVLADGEAVAVLAFHTRDATRLTPAAIDLVAAVAAQIGAVIRRRIAEAERDGLVAILEATPDAVMQRTLGGEVLYSNAAARRMYHMEVGDRVTAAGGEPRVYPPWAARVIRDEGLPGALRDGVWQGETAVLGPDGRESPVSQVILAHRDAAGAVTHVSSVMRDISERKRAEAALEQERGFLASVLEATPDCVKTLDLDGRLLSMNGPGRCLMEIDDFCLVEGADWVAFWAAGGVEGDARAAVAAARAGGQGRFQGFCPTAKGTPRWWDVMVTPVPGPDGQPAQLLAVSREMTEARRAAEALESEHAFVSAVLEHLSDGVAACDAEGRLTLVNRATREFHGLPDAPLPPAAWAEHDALFREDGVTPVPTGEIPLARVHRGETVRDEAMVIAPNGFPPRTVLASGRRFTSAAGVPLGAVVVMRDVTERARAEAALRESEERFRLLVSQVADYAIFRLDARGHVESWNAGAERLKGYAEAEILGAHLSRFYPEEARAAGRPDALLDIATRRGRAEEEGWRVRRDGSRFWARVTITALRTDAGAPAGFAKITRDLTEQHEVEAALRESEGRVRGAVEASLDALFVLRACRDDAGAVTDFVIAECNRRGEAFAAAPRDRLLGRSAGDVFPRARRRGLHAACARVAETGEPFTTEYRMAASGAPVAWAWLQVVRVGDGVAITVRDITAQKASDEVLHAQAMVDELTGVYNRRGFLAAAEREWQRAGRERHGALLAYLDLNDFKGINDTYGHAEGDRALRAVGDVLHAAFRGADVIGRLGGDEFAVLIVPTGPGAPALDIESVERLIRDRLAQHLAAANVAARAAGRAFDLSLSVGVARAGGPVGQEMGSLASLMAAADEQLYEEKRVRRTACSIAAPTLRTE